MTELVLDALVDERDAGRVLRAKAPGLEITQARLRHHPFAGFEFSVPRPGGGISRTHVLVDYFSGKGFLSGPWQHAEQAPEEFDPVSDPGWNTIDFETARDRAAALVRTAALRRARLAWRGGVREEHSVQTVWKPNWVMDVALAGNAYQIMVDGVNGGYFIVGA